MCDCTFFLNSKPFQCFFDPKGNLSAEFLILFIADPKFDDLSSNGIIIQDNLVTGTGDN